MSFGNKRLDAAYDRWVTQSPYDDEDDEDEDDEETTEPDMSDWADIPEDEEPVDVTKNEEDEDE